MLCLDCGYMMSPFDKDCTRCAKLGKPIAQPIPPMPQQVPADFAPDISSNYCANCGSGLPPNASFCPQCSYNVAANAQGKKYAGPRDPNYYSDGTYAGPNYYLRHSQPRIGLIITMWMLTAIELFVFFVVDRFIAYAIDVVAIIIAVALANGKSGADKANGWVKLGLELAAFVMGFMGSYLSASSGSTY